MLTTAHPHLDRASKGMLNYAAGLGRKNEYRFFLLGPDAAEPEVIARRGVREPAYMHSFGLSERWIVLAEFPYVVNPLRLAFSGRPYIENYRWKPELGTRFTLIDRATGEASGPFETDPFFGFHHVNAYDEGDEVVVDICVFDDAQIVEDLYLERLRAGKPVAKPELRRFRVRPGDGTVTHERLVEDRFDLPRINYGRCNERPYRYVWGVGIDDSGWLGRIVKADLETRRRRAGRSPAALPASRCSSPPRERRARTRACCSRSCSTPSAAARSCSCSTPRPSRSWLAPRRRTTSRSAFTASSRQVSEPLPVLKFGAPVAEDIHMRVRPKPAAVLSACACVAIGACAAAQAAGQSTAEAVAAGAAKAAKKVPVKCHKVNKGPNHRFKCSIPKSSLLEGLRRSRPSRRAGSGRPAGIDWPIRPSGISGPDRRHGT